MERLSANPPSASGSEQGALPLAVSVGNRSLRSLPVGQPTPMARGRAHTTFLSCGSCRCPHASDYRVDQPQPW